MPTKKQTTTIQDFEKSLEKLNQLVEKMETGNLSLESALKQFEEGVSLIKSCQKTLSEADMDFFLQLKIAIHNSAQHFAPLTCHNLRTFCLRVESYTVSNSWFVMLKQLRMIL